MVRIPVKDGSDIPSDIPSFPVIVPVIFPLFDLPSHLPSNLSSYLSTRCQYKNGLTAWIQPNKVPDAHTNTSLPLDFNEIERTKPIQIWVYCLISIKSNFSAQKNETVCTGGCAKQANLVWSPALQTMIGPEWDWCELIESSRIQNSAPGVHVCTTDVNTM